jgi:ATP-dependent DNA ligase
MINFALKWKEECNFKQISYNDFVTIPDDNAIFMAKVDGMLGALIFDKDNFFFQTTTGKSINDIPALYEYSVLFKKYGITQAIIPGELVAQRGGTILPFNDTQSIVKKFYVPANKDLIYHYPVDIVSLNNSDLPFLKSLGFLSKIIGKTGLPHIKLPKYEFGKLESFRNLYKEILGKPGYDGVVARNYIGKNYKIKFVGTVDLVVIGAGHENMLAWKKGEVSYLLTSFIDKDGLFRSSSKIGTGFKKFQRIKFFKFVKDNFLYVQDSEYFLKPQLVVEMKYFRYRITDTPTYVFEKDNYKQVGNSRSVTFSHPSFERIRSDKKATKYDTRLEQIPEFSY